MTRRFCIISRESSSMLGYLLLALGGEPTESGLVEFISGRRQGRREAAANPERRHEATADNVLATRGYVVLERDSGGALQACPPALPALGGMLARMLSPYQRMAGYLPPVARER